MHMHTSQLLALQMSKEHLLWPSSGCTLLSTRQGVSYFPGSSKYQCPQHFRPKWPWADFLNLCGSFTGQLVLLLCVCLQPKQWPKAVPWRKELEPEGRRKGKQRGQGKMLFLFFHIPAQRILHSNPPVRVGSWEDQEARGCPLGQTVTVLMALEPGAWLGGTGNGEWGGVQTLWQKWKSLSLNEEEKKGVSLTDSITIGREGWGKLLLPSHLAWLPLPLHFPRLNNCLLLEDKFI